MPQLRGENLQPENAIFVGNEDIGHAIAALNAVHRFYKSNFFFVRNKGCDRRSFKNCDVVMPWGFHKLSVG